MLSAHQQFLDNLSRVRSLGHLAVSVDSLTTNAVDTTDLLRSQIVLSVSALDYFVHELSRIGCVQVADGGRPKTAAWERCQIPVRFTDLAIGGAATNQWMGEAIREKHAWLSFQHPDKIADAIRLFSNVRLWDEVGIKLGDNAANVKTRLIAIVDRRNKIAHEADIDPTNPGFRWPINAAMVNPAVDFLEKVGNAIFDIVK